jgi:hypothetical protein
MKRLMPRELLMIIICLLLAVTPATADISYTIALTADYTVNGVQYSQAPLTITGVYDPSTISSQFTGERQAINESATLSGPGFGTATFASNSTIAMQFKGPGAVGPYFGLGVGPSAPSFFVTVGNPFFASMSLASPPLTTISGAPLIATFGAQTSDGPFAISAAYGQDTVTFQTVAVPEPSSFVLVGILAAASVGAFIKRRASRSAEPAGADRLEI